MLPRVTLGGGGRGREEVGGRGESGMDIMEMLVAKMTTVKLSMYFLEYWP